MQVVLPVGISFFTFQGMSYVIDIYRRQTAPATPARHGPADELLPASRRGADRARRRTSSRNSSSVPEMTRGMAAMGLSLIVWGLFKKAVIASELATGAGRPGLLRSLRPWQPRPDRRRPMAMRSRSIATSPPIATWRSGSRLCSAIASRTISTSPIAPTRCRISGGAGISACRAGCATISTSRSAARATG